MNCFASKDGNPQSMGYFYIKGMALLASRFNQEWKEGKRFYVALIFRRFQIGGRVINCSYAHYSGSGREIHLAHP